MSSECTSLADEIVLYAAGLSEDNRKAEVERHLHACEECLHKAVAYRQIYLALHGAHEARHPHTQTAQQPEPTRKNHGALSLVRRLTVPVAACLALILGAALYLPQQSGNHGVIGIAAEDGDRASESEAARASRSADADAVPSPAPDNVLSKNLSTVDDSVRPSQVVTEGLADADQPSGRSEEAPRMFIRMGSGKRGYEITSPKELRTYLSRHLGRKRSAIESADLEWYTTLDRLWHLCEAFQARQSEDPEKRLDLQWTKLLIVSEAGGFQQELKEFRRYVELHDTIRGTSDTDAMILNYAKRHFRKQQYAEARELYELLLARCSDPEIVFDARLDLAGITMATSHPLIAYDEYMKLCDDAKGTEYAVRACKRAAEIVGNRGNIQQALEVLGRLESEFALTDDDRRYARFRIATTYMRAGRKIDAIAGLRAVAASGEGDTISQTASAYLKSLKNSEATLPLRECNTC